MKKIDFTIHPGGKEIFNNNEFIAVPTLQTTLHKMIKDNKKTIDALLSIKIVTSQQNNKIDQYNIETKKFITNITTHNGLDFHIMQYDKNKKTKEVYTPYSNPGYDFFAHMLCAYYEVCHKRPFLDFKNIDVKSRNKENKGLHNPLSSFVKDFRWKGNIFNFLQYKEDWKEDAGGVKRIVGPNEKDNFDANREGFGIQDKNTIMRFGEHFYEKNKVATIIIENALLPLYLQAFIDTNFSVAGPRNATNLKKIYEVVYYLLENEEAKKRFDFSEYRKNTPLK